MIARAKAALTFARYMPVRKLAWRVWLTAQRQRDVRLRPRLPAAAPPLAPAPPLPIFPPRNGKIWRGEGGWHCRFIGRSEIAGDPIDWQLLGPGARHQLWRMNLHYFEYLEELSAEDGLALIRDWIAKHPPYAPGYWRDSWNSYAVSLRLVCWMQFLARHATFPDDVTRSIALQLRFLVRNLERDLGGNHLMKNIKALLWASAFFAGEEAAAWRRLGLRLLADELPVQVLADGVHDERSPSYHAQVLADLIECRAALPAPDAALDGAIARMRRVVADLAHPDGTPALFNDAGLTMCYAPAQCLVASGGALPPQRVFGCPQGGYFGAHLDRLSVIVDMGRIGPDDLPAHAHGDVGSFELSVDGQRMIVDQGVFEYVAGDKRRQARAAASHNVLALDGVDQAEFFGAFRCGRRPDVRVDLWQPGADGFVLEGRHNGYAAAARGLWVIRRVEVTPEGLRLVDRLTRPVERTARIGLLLHPEARPELTADGAIVRRGTAELAISGAGAWRIEPAVWWPDMGHEVVTTRLCLTWPRASVEGAVDIRLGSRD